MKSTKLPVYARSMPSAALSKKSEELIADLVSKDMMTRRNAAKELANRHEIAAVPAMVQAAKVETGGATGHALARDAAAVPRIADSGLVRVAVCGAHMSGLPLNPQLTSRGGKLEAVVRSAPCYRFYALPGGPPKRPGMVRVAQGGGSVEMEIWSLPATAFGSFVTGIPSPLGIGTVQLENGGSVHGFVCEAVAAEGAEDITHLGSWRAFVNRAS